MKILSLLSFAFVLIFASCNKEVIRPVEENENQMELRSGNRNPNVSGEEGGGITDPDNESEEEKVRNKKRKAR
jgi:hypothetical protein